MTIDKKAAENQTSLVFVSGALEADASIIEEFKQNGFEVVVCKDPKLAPRISEVKPSGWKPGVFLVDAIIPRMSGFELVRRILSRYQSPVIMMSPYVTGEDMHEATSAGAVALLKRPLTAKSVISVLEKQQAKK